MGTEHSRAKVYYTFSWRYAIPLVRGTLYLWLEVHYTFGRRYAIPLIGGTLHLYLRALALPSFGGVGGGWVRQRLLFLDKHSPSLEGVGEVCLRPKPLFLEKPVDLLNGGIELTWVNAVVSHGI